MGFRQADSEGRGGFARLWSVEDKGNYSLANVSTSKKRKDDNSYETDFQDGYVRLIGSAHTKAATLNIPKNGVTIQIKSCDVQTSYNAEQQRAYTNYLIYAFDTPDENTNDASTKSSKSSKSKSKVKTKVGEPEETEDEDDDDLPF